MKIELIEGALLKDGQEIGRYNATTNTLHCPHRISPKLYAPICDAIGRKPEYDFGTPNASEPEPERDPMQGDKTPAFVLWLCRTNPAEAVRRYAGRHLSADLRAAIDEAASFIRKP